jgi:hypothetical protein
MITALSLLAAHYADVANGITPLLATVPKMPGEVSSVAVEVYTEADLTDQGRDLAMGVLPVPGSQGVGQPGKVLLGLTLAKPGFNIDPKLLPSVRRDQVAISHLFFRQASDPVRGTRDVFYVMHATLRSQRILHTAALEASRLYPNAGAPVMALVQILDEITLPTYQATEDVALAAGFITVWEYRDLKPTG